MTTKKYTWEEIAKHNTRKDCWIVVRGKVYDVTHFLDEVTPFNIKSIFCFVFFFF